MEINKLEVQVLEEALMKVTELQTLNELELLLIGGGNATVDFG